MKVLFTGAGSIGTRHIKNLHWICEELGRKLCVDVLRKTDRILPEDVKKMIDREIRTEAELREQYDAVFLTDETYTHYENLNRFMDRTSAYFIEKPLFEAPVYDIKRFEGIDDKLFYVAAPIRFSKYYKMLEEVVSKNEIYSVRIIFSGYMPNWQKGRDYRQSFRCFTDRGGGVDIDSLHEIDYMTALFGQPKGVKRVAGKFSDLEMDACDVAVYIFEYEDKIVEMHLDYFGRVNNRRVELFTKDDVIVVDFHKRMCEYQLSGTVREYGVDDQFYQNEMRYFLSLLDSNGRIENMNSLGNAFRSLKLAKGD